jgi:adenine-specific DNA-methyltransferase
MPTLDWLNRQDAFATAARVPYRLLEQVSVHGDAASHAASLGNLLIQGDNLEALKALLPFYRGQVKCIFIDPPYNTRSAFEHYDDNLEHSQWLSMMLPRLQLLRELLREDGSIWVTIDDNEGHYLKVLMDEVFGRGNFVANVIWQKRVSPANDATHFSTDHDNIFVYTKHKTAWSLNRLERTELQNSYYKNPDDDNRGPWNSVTYTGNKTRFERPNLYYGIKNPNTGEIIFPPETLTWRYGEETHRSNEQLELLYWGKNGDSKSPRLKMFLNDAEAVVPRSVWSAADAGSTQLSMTEQKALFPAAFGTPKPELLLQRILHIASNENDLILDSFLGSGTTAAVAHKMGRRWIGIEMGEHAATHCLPRLEKVVSGEQGGISKALSWAGGGGFRFMRLGEPVFDETGRIHSAVRFNTLAAFIWQQETRSAWDASGARAGTPHLGIYYEIDSSLRSIYADEVPKTLGKPIEKADLFTPPNPAAQEPGEQAAPVVTLAPQPRFALYLLYNGILKDKRPQSGNVLTAAVLQALLALHADCCQAAGLAAQDIPLTVYGEACRLGPERLAQAGMTFRHIPYDVRAR